VADDGSGSEGMMPGKKKESGCGDTKVRRSGPWHREGRGWQRLWWVGHDSEVVGRWVRGGAECETPISEVMRRFCLQGHIERFLSKQDYSSIHIQAK
jgi:hypothetical protein